MTTATTNATMNPVQAFLEKVKTDTQLRSQLESLAGQCNNDSTQGHAAEGEKGMKQALGEIVKIAERAGFKFTTKDYEHIARKMYARNSKSTQPIGAKELISVACGCARG